MTEQEKVISFVKTQLENDKRGFRVIDNTGDDKKAIAGAFPDIILMRPIPPPNNDILFLLKVETGEDLLNRVSDWKALGSTPSVLYVVIPSVKRNDTLKFIGTLGIKARIATYEMEGDTVKLVNYE